MSRVTHILDSSAILAHYFDEVGAESVAALWDDGRPLPGISVVTVPELFARLRSELGDDGEAHRVVQTYARELTVSVPIDRAVAELAIHIRVAASTRIPTIDSLIAACARAEDAVLVHRDPHFAAIPAGVLRQFDITEAPPRG